MGMGNQNDGQWLTWNWIGIKHKSSACIDNVLKCSGGIYFIINYTLYTHKVCIKPYTKKLQK